MGNQLLGFGLTVGAGFLKFLAGAATLYCKAFTAFPYC